MNTFERFPSQLQIHGKDHKEKRIDPFKARLEEQVQKGAKRYRGEREKTEEDCALVAACNDLLKRELAVFGIHDFNPFPSERVHILQPGAYHMRRKLQGVTDCAAGWYEYKDDVIVVRNSTEEDDPDGFYQDWLHRDFNEDDLFDDVIQEIFDECPRPDTDDKESEEYKQWDAKTDVMCEERLEDAKKRMQRVNKACVRLYLQSVILHEMIHSVGAKRMRINKKEKIISQRSGFNAGFIPNHSREVIDHFRSLNEAIVETMTQEFLARKTEEDGLQRKVDLQAEAHELSERYPSVYWQTLYGIIVLEDDDFSERGGRENELYLGLGSYAFEREILGKILSGLARASGESLQSVWERFKRGYFDGSLMFLREIERVFGKGSLRVLASIRPDNSEHLDDEQEDPDGERREKRDEKKRMIREYFSAGTVEREHLAKGILADSPYDLSVYQRRVGHVPTKNEKHGSDQMAA